MASTSRFSRPSFWSLQAHGSAMQDTGGLSSLIRHSKNRGQKMGLAQADGLLSPSRDGAAGKATEGSGFGGFNSTTESKQEEPIRKRAKKTWSMKDAQIAILQAEEPVQEVPEDFESHFSSQGDEGLFPFPPLPPSTDGLLPILSQGHNDWHEGTSNPWDLKGNGRNPFSSQAWVKPIQQVWTSTSGLMKQAWQAISPRKQRESSPTVSNGKLSSWALDKPKGKQPSNRAWKKRSTQDILAIAARARKHGELVKSLEQDFTASSSRKSKEAVRSTVEKVFVAAAKDGKALPATPEKIKLLGAVLKEAQYKAGGNYLGEYKLVAIEAGQNWTDQLDRTLKLCRRALERFAGPKKKAAEVETLEEGGKFAITIRKLKDKPKVPLAKELFEFGVVWMLREIELSNLLGEHISVDEPLKRVTLSLPSSKTDQKGEGVSRVLQCLCEDKCKKSCPVEVTKALLKGMEDCLFDAPCSLANGKKASKAQLVQAWKLLFGPSTTGHSARRTGALRYIKLRWPLAQVAYLGRWKSSVIYDYAAEALEALPVNNNPSFDPKLEDTKAQEQNLVQIPNVAQKDLEEVRDYLTAELAALKQDQNKMIEALDKEVESLRSRGARRGDRLPPYVQALASKIVHVNLDMPNCAPPYCWKTKCGWSFGRSDYVFLDHAEDNQVCKKCQEQTPAHSS